MSQVTPFVPRGDTERPAAERIRDREIANALEAVRDILACTDQEFASRAFLLSRLRKVGLSYNDWPEIARYADWKNLGQFGVQQIPTEFVDFLMYIATLGLKTGIEVGVWHGASCYFATAVLQRANADFRMTMVDREDQLVAYDDFAAALNITKRIPATAEECAGEAYDFVFIDGDHSYDGVQRDYLLLGRYARKVCAFHDVRGEEFSHLAGGPVRFWQEFVHNHCQEMAILEFGHFTARPWMGIGVAVRST
jgi:hypothetical protein